MDNKWTILVGELVMHNGFSWMLTLGRTHSISDWSGLQQRSFLLHAGFNCHPTTRWTTLMNDESAPPLSLHFSCPVQPHQMTPRYKIKCSELTPQYLQDCKIHFQTFRPKIQVKILRGKLRFRQKNQPFKPTLIADSPRRSTPKTAYHPIDILITPLRQGEKLRTTGSGALAGTVPQLCYGGSCPWESWHLTAATKTLAICHAWVHFKGQVISEALVWLYEGP